MTAQLTLDGNEKEKEKFTAVPLNDRYGIAPFSVFHTNKGIWQKNRRKWENMGLLDETGRKENLLKFSNFPSFNFKTSKMQQSSTFDPFLSELMYRWFAPKKGYILDPFAGNSRGIVAEYLGYHYVGIELREEQIINNQQIAEKMKVNPTWILGDSYNMESLVYGKYDFLFTCPPYYNLEKYSNLKEDVSNFPTYKSFLKRYEEIFVKSFDYIKNNRFIVVVVSDIRDKEGFYNPLPADTIHIFGEHGIRLYNIIIKETSTFTLQLRVGKLFKKNRKIGRRHEDILIFFKGNPAKIKDLDLRYMEEDEYARDNEVNIK